VNDNDYKVMLSMFNGDYLAERLDADDYTYLEDGTTDVATALTSLGFIRATLRRTARLWCTIGVTGMVIGFAVFLVLPPSYKATTSLLLTTESTASEASGQAILNEQAVAQSRAVAVLAMQKMGLQENINKFLGSYVVTVVTDRIITITVSAKTGSRAVSEASALATEFLQYRANLAETELALTDRLGDQQIAAAQQNVKSIDNRITQVSAEPTSPANQTELRELRTESAQASLALTTLQTADADTAATAQTSTDQEVQGSEVLNAATLAPHSQLKRLVEFVAIGLIAGLAIGLGFVLVRVLISDRLRRRDDVARALGAPVKISAGVVRLSRWRPGRRGLAVARSANVQRIVAYLDSAVPPSPRGPASLAVVPVDDVRVPAVCLASLALSCAQRGLQVVVADLCPGAPAARLLGARDPGVQTVNAQGTQLTVTIPERDDVMLAGPLQHASGRGRAAPPLADASASADLLLTLAPLDPSLGAEHLTGWARSAVAMVTAGQSSAQRIHAVGEMARLAGLTLISGVLIGADKTDESLGETVTPVAGADSFPGGGLHSGVEGLFFTADGPPRARPSED
jgi:capsular polysaccharide biosynthesis protein